MKKKTVAIKVLEKIEAAVIAHREEKIAREYELTPVEMAGLGTMYDLAVEVAIKAGAITDFDSATPEQLNGFLVEGVARVKAARTDKPKE